MRPGCSRLCLLSALLLSHPPFGHKDGGAGRGSFFAEALTPNIMCGGAVQTNVCLPRNYSSMDIPFGNEANLIKVELHISDVLKINDRDFSITFSLYFNVQWREPRLNLNPSFFQNSSMDEEQLNPVDLNLINDLWVPNVFIYNLKTFKVIDVLSKLAGLWVNAKKEIMYSQASQITFICPMIFSYFPLDTQVCKFQVGSYSYNMEKMIFEVTHLGYSHTSRSIVLDYGIAIRSLPESDRVFEGGALGNYSLAGFEMVLVRHVMHYIINYYLPSGLFVVVSWISFLVPAEVLPGRMALLVTLFLVLVNIFNTVTTNTPKAEGLTAIEAWMLACILFVFGALTEYAGILFRRGWEENEDEEEEEEDGWRNGRELAMTEETTSDGEDDDRAALGVIAASNTMAAGNGRGGSIGSNSQNNLYSSTAAASPPPPAAGSVAGHIHHLHHHHHPGLLADGQQQQQQLDCQQHQVQPHQDQHRQQEEQIPLNEMRQPQFEEQRLRPEIGPPPLRKGRRRRHRRRRENKDNNKYSMSRRQREFYAKVDRFFLVFFPILFLVFNLIYWTAYYYGEQARSGDLRAALRNEHEAEEAAALQQEDTS